MSNHQHTYALKFLVLFFALLTIPLDYKFYSYLFSGVWLDFHITDLIRISSYLPNFFNEVDTEAHLGFDGFYSWILVAGFAIIGVFIWNSLEKRRAGLWSTDVIYYWLRVVLRYKLAFILIAYGSIKAFPLQFPFPSLSNLHTNYGDFLPWKIWAHTVGIASNYEAFLGGLEILAGLFLLYRRTVTFGAALAIGIIVNVAFSSFAYDMGNQTLSVYSFVVALFLFAHDLPRLYVLLFKEEPTTAEQDPGYVSSHIALLAKGFSAALVLVIFLSALFNYKQDPYLIPKGAGLKGAYGFYNVKQFIINGDTIAYSRSDTSRWQNVVFETWSTISIKTAKPVKPDTRLYLTRQLSDIDRVYESAGVGDRRYFRYTIDSVSKTLNLHNKNANYKDESYQLIFERPDANTIVLKGVNERKDSVTAVLERADRKYILIETRRFPIKL